MEQMLEEALECLQAQSAEVELSFKYFVGQAGTGQWPCLDTDLTAVLRDARKG